MRAKLVDGTSPIAYGYGENLSIYSAPGLVLGVSSGAGRPRRRAPLATAASDGRRAAAPPTTRTGPGPPAASPLPEEPKVEPWQAAPVTDEQLRNPLNVIPPAQRPRVVLRYGDAATCSCPGCSRTATRSRSARRWSTCRSTRGTSWCSRTTRCGAARRRARYGFVFNAILNFDHLDAGRKADPR